MKTIILVEDDDCIRELEALLLREAGLDVFEAGTGREARVLLKIPGIDGAVLDMNMDSEYVPKEYIIQLRMLCPLVKILIVSGEPLDFLLGFAGEMKVDSVIHKPFSLKEFIEPVSRMFN